MPYFQRKPIEGLVDPVLATAAIPGLPSRVRALPAVTGAQWVNPPAAVTGIVDQAAAVLATERPGAAREPSIRSDAGSVASNQNARIGELQGQVNRLIEQFVALASRPPSVDLPGSPPIRIPGQQPYADAGTLVVEPAPVLAPPAPVAPGGTAQISISLVNEDEQPAQIAFFSTGLIGEDGECISADRVSFQPCELMLSPGQAGEVIVCVVIPAQTRCGVYSGLIRASKLEYLHAVLIVQVDYP